LTFRLIIGTNPGSLQWYKGSKVTSLKSSPIPSLFLLRPENYSNLLFIRPAVQAVSSKKRQGVFSCDCFLLLYCHKQLNHRQEQYDWLHFK